MLFKDVTSEAGIDHVGITFGSSWGDFNGDRLPDLWLGNHGHDADLYLNQGDGTFVDISSEVFTDLGSRDRHGAAWGDFDNDGDQDLIQLIGGKVGTGNLSDPNFANQLFINEGGTLVNEAELYGVDYASSRAKTPVWLDVNRDGLLDLFVGAASRRDGLVPTTIFQQKNGELGFTNLADNSNFKLLPGTYGFLSDLVPSRDGLELAVIDNANDGLEIYDSRTIANISDEVIDSNLRGKDFVSADFNGDLLPDLYITRQGLNNSGFARDSNGKIRLRLESTSDVTKGIRFKVDGDLSLDFYTFGFAHDRIEADDIYIGASGFNPDDLTFSLAADNPEVAGIQSFREGIDEGVYIGHTPDSQTWEIILSSANQDLLLGFLDSTAAISDLTAIDFDNNRPPQQDSLLINDNGQLKDFSVESGINSVRNAGLSAVAGDFDNDMDEDIYVVTANQVINEPNIFYENQGDGTFIAREDALGAADLNLGIGDSVTTADYNLDGFLDLFVTNGRDLALLNEDGAVQLFENQGNSNHWLAIDLEGIISNRDGVGAKVYVTAGGKTQLKQQTGGIHNRSQNHSRLHVGLGSNETVEEIIVEWTSGIVQTINDVPADQLIQIVEPKIFFTPHKPVAPGNSRVLSWQDIFKDLENGVKISGYTDSASGAPNYDLNQEGLFIWQDDAGWHLRATGDITGTRYQGSFKTDGADFSVSRINLEDNDIITQPNPQQLDFDLRVLQGFEDGIDFNLPENSSLTLDLGDRTQGLDLVRIGAEQLSIDAL